MTPRIFQLDESQPLCKNWEIILNCQSALHVISFINIMNLEPFFFLSSLLHMNTLGGTLSPSQLTAYLTAELRILSASVQIKTKYTWTASSSATPVTFWCSTSVCHQELVHCQHSSTAQGCLAPQGLAAFLKSTVFQYSQPCASWVLASCPPPRSMQIWSHLPMLVLLAGRPAPPRHVCALAHIRTHTLSLSLLPSLS